MDKELEALERLAMPDEMHIEECKKLGIDLTEDYEVVKKAILELKAIKEANPSEAFEILENISKEECLFKDRSTIYMGGEKVNSFTWKHTIGEHFKGIKDIEQALLKAQENVKILSVIKEKHLFEATHKYIVDYSKDYNTYCKLFESYKLDEANKLIENEFNLLKTYFEKKYVKIIARNVKRGS